MCFRLQKTKKKGTSALLSLLWRKGQRPWKNQGEWASFIDILALLIFGGVLFPNMEGLVDLAAIDAFLAFHHGKESPVVAILAMHNTFDQ